MFFYSSLCRHKGLPRLAEFRRGVPKVKSLSALSGASPNLISPLTTAPRVFCPKDASLGRLQFHHVLYTNGAPRPVSAVVVRGINKRWHLARAERAVMTDTISSFSNTNSCIENEGKRAKIMASTEWRPLIRTKERYASDFCNSDKTSADYNLVRRTGAVNSTVLLSSKTPSVMPILGTLSPPLFANGTPKGWDWLFSVWERDHSEKAGSSEGTIFNNQTHSKRNELRCTTLSELESILGCGLAAPTRNAPIMGTSVPYRVGTTIDHPQRVTVKEEFIPLLTNVRKGLNDNQRAPQGFFVHNDSESFLFPTGRMKLRLHVPPEIAVLCQKLNLLRIGEQVSSGIRTPLAISDIDLEAVGVLESSDDTTTAEFDYSKMDVFTRVSTADAYGLSSPYHEIVIDDGDVAFIPCGWRYELLRESRRVARDAMRSNTETTIPRRIDARVMAKSFANKFAARVEVPLPSGDDSASSSSPFMSNDCFRVSYERYPVLTAKQLRAYLVADFVLNGLESFYERGKGNDPYKTYM